MSKFWNKVKDKLVNVIITLLTICVFALCSFGYKVYDVVVNKYPALEKEQKVIKQYINDNTKLTFILVKHLNAGSDKIASVEFMEELEKRYMLN